MINQCQLSTSFVYLRLYQQVVTLWVGTGNRARIILSPFCTMDSHALPVQNFTNAGFLFDRDTPFSPFFPKEDAPASSSQTPLPSPGDLSSSTSIRTRHRYCLTGGKGKGNHKPWLTLLVNSRSPRPKSLPLFIGKDAISGTVELDLPKPETVREVKVTVGVVFPMCIAINLPPSSLRASLLTSPRTRRLFLKSHKF